LDYVPLPDPVVQLDMETLKALTFNGDVVLITECDPGFHKDASGNCVPDVTPPPPPDEEKTFTISSSLDGKSYAVTGKSETVEATSFTINPKESVIVAFDGAGEVELTLPKTMIDGINSIRSGSTQITYQQVNSSSTSNTIKFTVPQGTDSVEIQGAMVVPEFPIVVAMILAATIGGIALYSRFARNGLGLGQRI